jgi:hypothetical protein
VLSQLISAGYRTFAAPVDGSSGFRPVSVGDELTLSHFFLVAVPAD